MLNFKSKVLIIFIVALMIICVIQINSNASNGNLLIIEPGTKTQAPATQAPATQIPVATQTPAPTPAPTSNTKLPQTGIEDHPGLLVAVIALGGLALYSYKKIKDYDKI